MGDAGLLPEGDFATANLLVWRRLERPKLRAHRRGVSLRLARQSKGLHHLHLFRRALAAVAEVLVEADELNVVSTDTDPELEPAARQMVE
jgi:hypothetical protein